MFVFQNKKSKKSGKRDSDPRPQPWQGCALPTELFPQNIPCQGWHLNSWGKVVFYQLYIFNKLKTDGEEEETRTPTSQLTLPPQSSASTNSATSPSCWITCEEKRVPRTGLEPARLAAHAPETCASTNSATWAFLITNLFVMLFFVQHVERKTGLGPATPTLARLCSTN